jgi:Ca2+-binding EF-hand superfamily protein
MGLCSTKAQRLHAARSRASFHAADTSGDGALARDELLRWIAGHGELWMMLQVNLSLSDAHCREIAVDTAFEITRETRKATGAVELMDAAQFLKFRTIVDDPRGQLEFFHRSVFNAFDGDRNGYLDDSELGAFLDTFYQAGSIFAGDARLPPKEDLFTQLKESSEAHGGHLDFEAMHAMIAGKRDVRAVSPKSPAAPPQITVSLADMTGSPAPQQVTVSLADMTA